jgi:hypothetical protein
MIRSTLSANSAFAIMLVSPGKGSAFQYRTTSGGAAVSVAGPMVAAPLWVKIVRTGTTLTGYTSYGAAWTRVGSASIAMGSTVQIGLAVSSHDNTRLATGHFDNVVR